MPDIIKTRYLPAFKSLVILGLAGLSVFLTIQLWLVNIPNRSFLPYLAARFTPAAPDGVSDLVRPSRIVAGSGNGYFHIIYNSIADSEFWEYGEFAITVVLQNGSFVSRTETDMSNIIEAPVLIYEYVFDMTTAIFSEAFCRRVRAALSDAGIINFRAVAIHPPQNRQSAIFVSFIGDDYTWQFSLAPTGRRVHEIFDGIAISENIRHPYRRFIPTEGLLAFAPRFHEDFYYHPLLVTNPYENHAGRLHLAFIHRQIEHFFDNPATINQGTPGGIYTYNNLNTVVRYLPMNVVEYTSFRTIGRTTSSFVANFSAALAFVNDDPNVTNDIFLAEYDIRGHQNVFWFGYAIDDFPIRMARPWSTISDCTDPLHHPIEVIVEHGRVIRYRKIAHTFDIDTSWTTRLNLSAEWESPLGFPIIGPNPQSHIQLQAITTE